MKNEINGYSIFRTILAPSILVGVFLFQLLSAQQCGPGCPACSGKIVGDLQPASSISFSGLFIPEGEEETAVYNFRYGINSWLDAGVGYARDEEEFIWSVRAQLVRQEFSGWKPSVILGTGSIQAGGSDQSAYIQLAKSVQVIEGKFAASVAGGFATDMPDFNEEWWLGTGSITLFEIVSPFYSYDGISSHAGVSVAALDWLTLTGYYLEMEEIAILARFNWEL